ncbi:19321_t:CDS:2, partial [Dentiscutata erythropus]
FLENVVFYKELAKDENFVMVHLKRGGENFGAIYELAECYVCGNGASKMKRRELWCNMRTSRMLCS